METISTLPNIAQINAIKINKIIKRADSKVMLKRAFPLILNERVENHIHFLLESECLGFFGFSILHKNDECSVVENLIVLENKFS